MVTEKDLKDVFNKQIHGMFEKVHNQTNEEVNQDRKNLSELYRKIPTAHVNLTHNFERVVTLEDVTQQRYMAMVQSLPQRSKFIHQLEKVFMFKRQLDKLNYQLD